MKNRFLKGIVTVTAYYAVGGLLAFIAYKLVGQSNVHTPALHHLILFAVWLGGCAWALYSIINRFLGKHVAYNRGTALANVVVCAATFVVVQQQIRSFGREGTDGMEQITTEFSGDTVLVRHRGNAVFLRIGDSVYLDELSRIYPADSLLKEH